MVTQYEGLGPSLSIINLALNGEVSHLEHVQVHHTMTPSKDDHAVGMRFFLTIAMNHVFTILKFEMIGMQYLTHGLKTSQF